MKILLLLTTLLTAVSPTGDPLSDLYLRQFLGIKFVPKKMSKNVLRRQVEFNTKFLASVVGPENMVSGVVNLDKRRKRTVSYSVHASPTKLKEKLVTITHYTRKIYPMGYKLHKLQWIGKNDFKIHMSTRNKNMILYFKYNEKHKLFNVWMK
jgi:hypothetical protein